MNKSISEKDSIISELDKKLNYEKENVKNSEKLNSTILSELKEDKSLIERLQEKSKNFQMEIENHLRIQAEQELSQESLKKLNKKLSEEYMEVKDSNRLVL